VKVTVKTDNRGRPGIAECAVKVKCKTDNRGGLEWLRAGWDLERMLSCTLCLCIARLQIPKLHSTGEGVMRAKIIVLQEEPG
jgi:hypothetical protein